MIRSTIRSRVADYLDRTDLNTRIDGWIEDTRLDLALKYPFRYLYVEATTSTVAGTKTYSFPSDYLGHAVLWAGSKKLARITPREFDELTRTDIAAGAAPRELTLEAGSTATTSSISSPPDYYCERGVEFEIYPTPDAVYTLRIKYFASPTAWATGSTADSNYDYITTFHYEAVIWGTAWRGAMYLDDQVKIESYKNAYDVAIKEMLKKEKDFETEDQHIRFKTYHDFDETTFKRLVKMRTP